MSDLTLLADIVRVLVFATFVALASGASLAGRRGARQRRWFVGAFVTYALMVSMGVGLIQRSFWPFSHWPMDNHYLKAEETLLRAVAVGRDGTEHELDFRALYPIDWWDLSGWLSYTALLNPSEFDLVAPELVRRIATARLGLENGERLPGDRGPLAAPARLIVPPVWTRDDGRSPMQVVGIRIYEYSADLSEFAARPRRDQLRLLFEYVEP